MPLNYGLLTISSLMRRRRSCRIGKKRAHAVENGGDVHHAVCSPRSNSQIAGTVQPAGSVPDLVTLNSQLRYDIIQQGLEIGTMKSTCEVIGRIDSKGKFVFAGTVPIPPGPAKAKIVSLKT